MSESLERMGRVVHVSVDPPKCACCFSTRLRIAQRRGDVVCLAYLEEGSLGKRFFAWAKMVDKPSCLTGLADLRALSWGWGACRM